MKGYVYNNTCYIFPNQEAAAIPEQQDVTEYLIQYDELDAYKEINTTLADKLFGYNYNTMTVNPKPWKDHQDDDLHRPGPTTLTLTYADGCEQYIAEEYRYNSVQNNDGTVLYAAEGVYFKDMEWMSHNYVPVGADGNPSEFDLHYTGGDAWFNNADDLLLSTHVDDPTVTEVTLSIVPRNYTGWQEVQVGEDYYENLKYRFADTEQFTSFDVGNMYYAHSGDVAYTLKIDGVDATFSASNTTDDGVITVRVYNPDTDETYFTQSSREDDLAEWTVQATTAATYVFTQVTPTNTFRATYDNSSADPTGQIEWEAGQFDWTTGTYTFDLETEVEGAADLISIATEMATLQTVTNNDGDRLDLFAETDGYWLTITDNSQSRILKVVLQADNDTFTITSITAENTDTYNGTFTFSAPENSASLDDQTGAITINLVNDTPFESDALAGLLDDQADLTMYKDNVEVNDWGVSPTYDNTDPENPILTAMEYQDPYGYEIFTVSVDSTGDTPVYTCTPNSEYADLVGTYVYAPIQL